MLRTADDIITELESRRTGEHLHVNLELKETWRQEHGDKISALANKINQPTTFLVVGVADDGTIKGRDESWAKQTEEVLSQHVNQKLDPVQSCKGISCRKTSAGWVVVVTIQNAGEVTYWGDHPYCASGTTTKQMEPDEILKLRIQLPGLIDYSKQYHKSAYNDDLVRAFTGAIVKRRHPTDVYDLSQVPPEDALRRLDLFERQAARLLFGKASYRVIQYDDQHEPVANERRQGLISLLLPEFIQKLCHEGEGHFSDRALKEALANAVAHAAYFENDGELMLEVYPDCITVSNLCIKESTYFANRWFSRSHKTVNGVLMEALRIAGFVDELGRGKNVIFSESIKTGKRPPEVHIESAGKYQRWKLMIYGGKEDEKFIRLLERSKEIYQDDRKALISVALVLWRDRPVTEIRDYVDGEFGRQFAEVLTSEKGPIFYYSKQEKIFLRRWAEVLLGEGKDSKALSAAEEEQLQSLTYEIRTKHHLGIITPEVLRELAGMGNTKSEQTLSSTILSKWAQRGVVRKIGKGNYEFIKKVRTEDPFADLLDKFEIPAQTPNA